MNILNKYIYVGEKYKISGKQNANGIWLCDKVEVSSPTKKELENDYRECVGIANKVNNEYNLTKKEKTTPISKQKKT